jgi:hypothetical protein
LIRLSQCFRRTQGRRFQSSQPMPAMKQAATKTSQDRLLLSKWTRPSTCFILMQRGLLNQTIPPCDRALLVASREQNPPADRDFGRSVKSDGKLMTCASNSAGTMALRAEKMHTTGPMASLSNLAVSEWLIAAALLCDLPTLPCRSSGRVADEIG